MKLVLKDIMGITKILSGLIAVFLVLFGIHWMLIASGVVSGAVYFAIPRKYLF